MQGKPSAPATETDETDDAQDAHGAQDTHNAKDRGRAWTRRTAKLPAAARDQVAAQRARLASDPPHRTEPPGGLRPRLPVPSAPVRRRSHDAASAFRRIFADAAPFRRPLIALGWLCGFLCLFALYLYADRYVGNNSDGAGQILQSQAILHGNLALRGWYMGPDPYNSTETVLDVLGGLIFSGEQLLKITPALLYAAAVAIALYLAGRCLPEPVTRRSRWLAAGACAALVAFPVGQIFSMDLVGSLHMGTIVASLLALVAYERYVKTALPYKGRARRPPLASAEERPKVGCQGQGVRSQSARFGVVWGWAGGTASWWLGLFVLMAVLAITGDPLGEVLIPVPVAITSAWVLWRTRGRERAAWLAAGAALLALVLGFGTRQLLIAAGMYMASAPIRLASPALVWHHVIWLLGGFAVLFHIVLWPQLGYAQRVPFIVLGAGFLLVGVVGFTLLLRRSLFPGALRDSFASVLCWGIVANCAAFLLTNYAVDLGGIRYLLPAFMFTGILCYAAISRVVAPRVLGRYVLASIAVSGLYFGVMLANARPASVPQQSLIAFLRSHHLTVGLGTYWTANITTLRSNGQVRVLAVQALDGRIHPYYWVVDSAWFSSARLSPARFVVTDELANIGPISAAVTNTFGAPDHTYRVGRYVIFAWDHPLHGTLAPPIIAP